MKISKLFRKTMICRVIHEEIIDGITYQGLRYYCPTCGEEVFSYQSKCSCGQRLKQYSKLNDVFDKMKKLLIDN